jgi:hypothetical protein
MTMQHKTATLDGKPVAYTDQTVFEVQLGRYDSAYHTRYTFTGNLHQAVRYYCCLNIGNGFKKRLVMVGANKPVLARQFS